VVGVEACSVIWHEITSATPCPGVQSDAMDKVVLNYFAKRLDNIHRSNETVLYCSNRFTDPCANGVNKILTGIYLPDTNSVTPDLCKT